MPRVNPATGLKVCSRCRKEQAADLCFAKDKSTFDGYSTRCKTCRKEYDKEYNATKEHKKEYHKGHYRANKEHHKEYNKEYHAANKEYLKEYNRKYSKANPQVGLAARHKRRARMLRADDGTVTKDVLRQMLDACGRRCMNPRCATPDSPLSIDHVVALQKRSGRKGKHSIFNIQILCRSCNSSKGHRRTVDYRPPDWPWLKPPLSN